MKSSCAEPAFSLLIYIADLTVWKWLQHLTSCIVVASSYMLLCFIAYPAIISLLQVSKRFCNWKNATTLFQKHQQSSTNKQAVEVMIVLPPTTKDVSKLLVTQLAREKEHNCRMFLKIVSCIWYLSRQGMALR